MSVLSLFKALFLYAQHCFISRMKNSTAFWMAYRVMRSLLPWMVRRSSLVRAMAEKR